MRTYLAQFITGARTSWALYLADLEPSIFFGVQIPRALFQAIFFVFMARAAGGDQLARFALIGNAIHVSVQTAIIYMASMIEGEKWSGTLIFWIVSPSNWLPSMLGRSLAVYCYALFSTTLILSVYVPILAPDITLINLLRAAPLILLTLASASTLGWLVGAIALPVRWGTMLGNVVAYLLMILCGINFPLTALPTIVQTIGRCIPVTNGLLAVRTIIDGGNYSSVLPLVGFEILIAIIFGSLAWLTFGYRLRITRQKGNFELV
jgi:ABC-2 type transport system permease protein